MIVIGPKGKTTIGAGDVALRAAIDEGLAAGGRKILIDLAGVTDVDSSAIGEMVHACTTVSNTGVDSLEEVLVPRPETIEIFSKWSNENQQFDAGSLIICSIRSRIWCARA